MVGKTTERAATLEPKASSRLSARDRLLAAADEFVRDLPDHRQQALHDHRRARLIDSLRAARKDIHDDAKANRSGSFRCRTWQPSRSGRRRLLPAQTSFIRAADAFAGPIDCGWLATTAYQAYAAQP